MTDLKDLFTGRTIRLFLQKKQTKKLTHELLSAWFQDVKILFALAYTVAANAANNEPGIKNNRKYFLTRGRIENFNVLIDGINFYN